MDFSNRLKYLRKQKGISQAELASQLKASRSALSLWELGIREPPQGMYQQMADNFGVSVDYLLGQTNDPRPIAEMVRESSGRYMPPGERIDWDNLPKGSRIKLNGEWYTKEEFDEFLAYGHTVAGIVREKRKPEKG